MNGEASLIRSGDESVNAVSEIWLHAPPCSLVIGNDPYAQALAMVLGCGFMPPADLLAGPVEIPGLGFPRVLGGLERVFLVAESGSAPADVLRWHESMWGWIVRLSPVGDQHDLSVVFVLSDAGRGGFAQSLLTGLALTELEPEAHGHGIWRMTDRLLGLVTTIGTVRPLDLAALKARKRADVRHAAVTRLRIALAQPDHVMAREAAVSLAAAFRGEEYNLDLFCRPPEHRHGNSLRQWLADCVTGAVTPEQWSDKRSEVAGWLVLPNNNSNS